MSKLTNLIKQELKDVYSALSPTIQKTITESDLYTIAEESFSPEEVAVLDASLATGKEVSWDIQVRILFSETIQKSSNLLVGYELFYYKPEIEKWSIAFNIRKKSCKID